MKSVTVTSSGHDTSCKLIDDQDLVILNNVVMILVHQVVGAKGQNDAVLNFQVLWICKVGNMEKFLNLSDAFSSQVNHFVLLIDDEIASLFSLHAHDCIDLGQIFHIFAALHLLGQNIAGFVDLGGFSALSGNDQRRTGLVDEDRVDLVDDGIMELTKNQLLFINCHVVTKVVKAQLVVGDIRDITAVLFLSLLAAHAVENNAYGQAHKCVDLSHPLCVTLSQVIVDGDYVHTSSLKGIEVCGHGGNQCLTFTGTHLRDTTLVQDDRADQLHAERFHAERSSCAFANRCIGFRKNVVKGLALRQSLFKFICLGTKCFITQFQHLRTKTLNLFDNRFDSSKFPLAVCTK